jgi:leucyl aminopeptidase
MELSLTDLTPQNIETACIVVGVLDGGQLTPSAKAIDDASSGMISQMLESRDIEVSLGKTTFLHNVAGVTAERVLLVGFGKAEKLERGRFDKACYAAGKTLRNHPITRCHVCVHDIELENLSESWRLRQAALAIFRANYRYTTTKKRKENSPSPLDSASFQGSQNQQAMLDQASCMGLGFHKARELGDLPANICNPTYLAQEAISIANNFDSVELDVLDEDQMAELGMAALLGVSQGSANPAKLIVLKHSGADTEDRPVVLVGKGITFDSGGLSMKSPENMIQMKYDMCGAAGVLGAFLACASLGLELNVICIVAAVENMPDGNAYRPGDVLTSMSGQTIEVLNTDAEGRLVLCDALTYSARFDPQSVIDVATLTGACVIALGHHASGLLSNDDDLASELLSAGNDIVDRAWRLPLWDEYQSQLDTPFADMQNVGGMSAGAVTAGCFLSRFTKDQCWAHLDIAGSAWKWGEKEGATGRPVGLLTRYLMSKAGVEAI